MSAKSPSSPMENPDDCIEVRSREQCKELVAAQAAAAEEAAESVNIEKCIQSPNPQCEAALGKVAEGQDDARQDEK